MVNEYNHTLCITKYYTTAFNIMLLEDFFSFSFLFFGGGVFKLSNLTCLFT